MKKPLVLIVFIVFLVFVGFGIVIPVMPDMVNSPSHLSWMLAIYSLISFLVSPAWGALSDRIGRRPVLMIGLAGFAFSFLLFGLAGDRLWQMYLSRILGGLFPERRLHARSPMSPTCRPNTTEHGTWGSSGWQSGSDLCSDRRSAAG